MGVEGDGGGGKKDSHDDALGGDLGSMKEVDQDRNEDRSTADTHTAEDTGAKADKD